MSHHTFDGGGIEIEQLHKGTEIEKNHFSSKPLQFGILLIQTEILLNRGCRYLKVSLK